MSKIAMSVGLSLLAGLWERFAQWMKRDGKDAMYRRFFELSNEGCVIVNMEGEFLAVNEAFADILGYSVEELIGQKFMHYVNAKWKHQTIEAMTELREGYTVEAFRNEYNCAGGTVKMLEWMATRGKEEIYATAREVEKE